METTAGRSPWLTMWTRPRATMREILDTDPDRMVVALAMLGGFSQSLDKAALWDVGDIFSVPVIILVAAVAGSIGGLIWLYVMGGLVRWTGRWIGGQAPAAHVRVAIAWPAVPLVWGLLIWIPELALAGRELFMRETPYLDAHPGAALAVAGLAFIEMAILVWTVVVFLKCLGEAQGFSAWKAMGNILLASAVFAVPVLALILGAGAVVYLFS